MFICFLSPTRPIWFFFFFSSKRRHTRSLRDWSSDVCSSDLRVVLRQQTPAIAGCGVMRAPTPLQNGQAEIGIFAERVARPAARVIERGAADQAHGAVHDDRIRLVALHHADIEESRVFGIHSRMDETAPAVTVILRRLDEADRGIREARYQGLQPVRMD